MMNNDRVPTITYHPKLCCILKHWYNTWKEDREKRKQADLARKAELEADLNAEIIEENKRISNRRIANLRAKIAKDEAELEVMRIRWKSAVLGVRGEMKVEYCAHAVGQLVGAIAFHKQLLEHDIKNQDAI